MTKQFEHIALGGTFDHFHAGHRRIIDTAFQQGKKVSIGITSGAMTSRDLKKELTASIESYSERTKTIETYLKKKRYDTRAQIFPLDDMYGTTISDPSVDCIVVTEETLPNANKINEKRIQMKLQPLSIVQIPFVKGNNAHIIRSTRIRSGEIDREGRAYLKRFRNVLLMPGVMRETLATPLHEPVNKGSYLTTAKLILKAIGRKKPVISIAVGDIVNKTLREVGYVPDISIIDLKTERQYVQKPLHFPDAHKVANPAGSIHYRAVQAIQNAIDSFLKSSQRQTIIIDGEEDLLALPAVLLSPLESVVLYGQRDQGVVMLKINESMKLHVHNLLKKFVQA